MSEQKIGGSIELSQHEYLDYLKVKSDLADLKAKYEKCDVPKFPRPDTASSYEYDGLYQAYEALLTKTKELEEANANCISLSLHEDRMRELERRLTHQYDRMNPTINELKERLNDYSKITYVRRAYELSRREAELLLEHLSEAKK